MHNFNKWSSVKYYILIYIIYYILNIYFQTFRHHHQSSLAHLRITNIFVAYVLISNVFTVSRCTGKIRVLYGYDS